MKMKKPNILMIVVHDLGTHLGCYRDDPSIPSSNLDRLAESGVRFDRNFCTAPYCSPSRGSIVTGKHPHVNGLLGLVNLGWDIADNNLFLAEALKKCGYGTSLIGLHHEARDPWKLGFDNIQQFKGNKCADVAPAVCEFLNSQNNEQDKPFYCQVGFSEVHRTMRTFASSGGYECSPEDVTPLPYLKDTPGLRKDMCQFHGTIYDMDKAVGDVLDTLDKKSFRDDTLVIFTTDHGIAFPRAKGTLYDAGINTTLLMRWPNGFKGNRVQPELISNIDLYPTLLEIAGGKTPEDVEGHSFLKLLKEQEYQQNEKIFAELNSLPDDTKRCIRTEKYKYIRNFNEGPALNLPHGLRLSHTGLMMGSEHLQPRKKEELYDLTADPNEQDNLAGNPEYTQIKKQLAEELQAFLERTNDPALAGDIPRPPDEAGRIQNYKERCEEHLANEKQEKTSCQE